MRYSVRFGISASARRRHRTAASVGAVTLVISAITFAAPMSGTASAVTVASWSTTDALSVGRYNAATALLSGGNALSDGDVLVAGGQDSAENPLASAELYNSATNSWSSAGTMTTARYDATATPLNDGDVLVAGGQDSTGKPLASAELYNSATNSWSSAGAMTDAREFATATLLKSGDVLVAGGQGSTRYPLASAELYDSTTNSWSSAGAMTDARELATATLLIGGDVLVAAGQGTSNFLASAELYDSNNNSWSTTGSLAQSSFGASAALLSNGDVLVAGGQGAPSSTLASAELYNPTNGSWSTTGSMTDERESAASAVLPDGKVLMAGGFNYKVPGGGDQASAELYDPTSGQWTATGSLAEGRDFTTATPLANGEILVAGGLSSTGAALAESELYDAANPTIPEVATTLAVSAPASVTTGVATAVTVTVKDQFGLTDSTYAGTVAFSSSDPSAVLPANATLTNGTGTFSVTLTTAGTQTVTATDTVTSTITGTSNSVTVSSGSTTGTGGGTGGGGTGGGGTGGGGGTTSGGGGGGTSDSTGGGTIVGSTAGTASGTVTAGGSFSSEPAGTAPSAANPLVVSITSPVAGPVTITPTTTATSFSGYQTLNIGAVITAPDASPTAPLRLTFRLYLGNLPAGSYPSDVTVFRDGVAVGSCSGAKTANPDPCLSASSISGGVETFTVLSSHASSWQLQVADVGRLAGSTRYATAVAASQAQFPNGNAGAVVLAGGNDYPDALVGTPLAIAKNAPLLLTSGTSVQAATKTEIQRVLPAGGTVYVLGGTRSIPASVATELTSLGYQVTRYGGVNHYATAVLVANALGNPSTVLLATGTDYPDALAAGVAAAKVGGVVLFTNSSKMNATTGSYLTAHAKTVYAIGGPAGVADPKATLIAGADRYSTAVAVAQKFFPNATTIGIATGENFPDALSGGVLVARAGAPMLLAPVNSVPTTVSSYLAGIQSHITAIHLFGGTSALNTVVQTQLTAGF